MDHFDYSNYWENRYNSGKNSGAGSYGNEAEFKARLIISAVKEHGIRSITDLGCGDGNLRNLYMNSLTAVRYDGYDFSKTVIDSAKSRHGSMTLHNIDFINKPDLVVSSDLVVCMDVLFHLPSQTLYDSALDVILDKSKRISIFSRWNDKILDRLNGGKLSKHCFLYKSTKQIPYEHKVIDVPNEPGKEIVVVHKPL